MVGGIVKVLGVGDVGSRKVDFRHHRVGNENVVKAGVLLLVTPIVGPEFLAGIFDEDVAEIALRAFAPHDHGKWRHLTGFIEVSVNNYTGFRVFLLNLIYVFAKKAGFVESHLCLVVGLRRTFGF